MVNMVGIKPAEQQHVSHYKNVAMLMLAFSCSTTMQVQTHRAAGLVRDSYTISTKEKGKRR